MESDRLLTEAEAAGLLGVRRRFLAVERKRGRIRYCQFRRTIRYRREFLDEYIAHRTCLAEEG